MRSQHRRRRHARLCEFMEQRLLLALPAGWGDADIGSPSLAGSANYLSGAWTVSGSGADIWNNADQFNFASESLVGNGSIVARVASLTNTNPWAKAGVMVRDSSAAGSMFVDVVVTPSNGVSFQWRNATGGGCNQAQTTGVTAPRWVKLTRSGETYAGFYSADGTTWTQVGTSQIGPSNYSALVGLAVTSHDNTQLNNASFDNVTVATIPTTVSVDNTQVVRTVPSAYFGTNITFWQWELNTQRMQQMITDAGMNFLRLGGGSATNSFHFNDASSAHNDAGVLAKTVEAVGATGLVTINYGTGSPQEGAAYLAYLDAQVGDATAIGNGQQWSDATTTWITKDWKTAGYWASIRASAPLAVDDGLNFLRISHPLPFNIGYFEVGNEDFATWENDRHGQGGDTGAPQDPATYVSFASTFSSLAHQIYAAAQVGLDVTLPMQWNLPDQQWTNHVLQQCASRGMVPGFLSDHVYITGLNDQRLLLNSANDPGFNDGYAPLNWAGRTATYRGLLNADLGVSGPGVKIMLTEFNCDLGSNQSTSLVSGLFMADANAGAMMTEYAASLQWDLTNGYSTSGVDTAGHYGWRLGSDNGMIGTGASTLNPASGAYVPYPAYFAEQLLGKMFHGGDTLVTANSNDPYLSTYAVREANGHLDLLVINKSDSTNISSTFNLAGFNATGQATLWQYGKAEDTAQSLTTDGHSALTTFATTLSVSGSSFAYNFPAYSMTVIDLTPVTVLPAGWTDGDIGSPTIAGSASYSSGTWTVNGAGSDIWNNADQFNFAGEAMVENGLIVARVVSLTNTNAWAKAGVMIRDSSAAGSMYVGIMVTPGNGVTFQWRNSTGGSSGNTAVAGVTAPRWVKLTRSGDSFTAFYSSDGVTWTQIGGAQTIGMTYSPLAGLAVTSHNTAQLATATITNVSVTTTSTAVNVNAGQTVRTVNSNIQGINLAWWDGNLNTSQTVQLATAAGLSDYRFPGGSSSDEYHFTDPSSYYWGNSLATIATFIASANGGGLATLNYGTGSPQEAAAFLSYLNAPTTSNVSIGFGQIWDKVNNVWVQKNWKTSGYWANLRASAPLATDDGLNYLRIGRSAPFAFHHYEIGNEVMGSWETDKHGSGGDTGLPHDAATYITFCKQFANYAHLIDASISIGIVADGTNSWTVNALTQCASQGFAPGYLSDHTYVGAPGSENDNTLLMHTSADPASGYYWPTKASGIRSLLTSYLGSAGTNIEILETEFNDVYSNPGKQSTSLVNGLYVADSLGSMLQSGYNGGWLWDLRNGWDTSNNLSSSVYGWRQGGDYGILGSGSNAPSSGPYIPYPTYFSEQLMSKLCTGGDTVVSVSTNNPYLSTYAVRQADGHLALLVINKALTSSISSTFNLAGFNASGQATLWQYGKTEDSAQRFTFDGHSALTTFSTTLTINSSSFAWTFPAYSMTVMDLTPMPPAPAITSTYLNDNSAQRSMVSSAHYTFSSPVTLGTGAFTLTRRRDGMVISVNFSNPSLDRMNYVLTFGSGGSVPDGGYSLKLSASAVTDAYGQHLAGGDSTLRFFRLFGDVNGDRQVTRNDLVAFRAALNQPLNYVWYLDCNNDLLINGTDYAQLRLRLNRPLL